MTHLKEGDKFPNFQNLIDKDIIKGKKLILYFYPKDNTPGCTNEAKNLRDNYDQLKTNNFEVIEEGDYVVCAVSGKNITLNQLTYWNVELQEAYFSPKEAQQRYEELNKK